MRFFAFVAASLALVFAVSASYVLEKRDGLPVTYDYKNGDKCPVQLFYNGCNFCTCRDDGYSAFCIMMVCPPKPHNVATRSVDEYPHKNGYRLEYDCVPGEKFYDKCNFCVCSPDGRSARCTVMSC